MKEKEIETMKFMFDNYLVEYMEKNNKKDILLAPMMCRTWSGSHLEISARFVDEEEVRILKEDGFVSIPHDFGEVLIEHMPAKSADVVRVGLSRFFKHIFVEGIYSV